MKKLINLKNIVLIFSHCNIGNIGFKETLEAIKNNKIISMFCFEINGTGDKEKI